MLVGVTLLVYEGKFEDTERGEICRAKPLNKQRIDPGQGWPQLESERVCPLKEEGEQKLWIRAKGELVDWEGKDDKQTFNQIYLFREMRSQALAGTEEHRGLRRERKVIYSPQTVGKQIYQDQIAADQTVLGPK